MVLWYSSSMQEFLLANRNVADNGLAMLFYLVKVSGILFIP